MAYSILGAWRNENLDDFPSRLAASSHIPETIPDSSPPSLDGDNYEDVLDPRDPSRFAQGGRVRSSGDMATVNTLPELDTSATTISSSTSSESIDPSTIGNQILGYDDDGELVSLAAWRPRYIYHCLFHILDCHQIFEDTVQWKIHVLSHFRSHPSPTDARCPLCPSSFSNSQRDVAWETMLDHVAEKHFQRGVPLPESRPDIQLMRYLFKLKVITHEQLRMVQLTSDPSSPGYHHSQDLLERDVGCVSDPVCVSANPKRERRMRAARNR